MIVCCLIYIDRNVYWNAVWNRQVSAMFSDICLEREKKKKHPNREVKTRNSHLAFWESSGLRKEEKKKKKKVWNNEFIKLKMHRPMERLDFNRRQMEREPPLLLRYADTASLIAWSCLVDSKSSRAMTWWEQVPGFVVRKNCLFNIHNQDHPPPLPASLCPNPSLSAGEGDARQRGQSGCCCGVDLGSW